MLSLGFGLRPATVRAERESPGTGERLARSTRFARDEEDIERFWVLISNMSRDLLVMPASITIRIQTRLASVSPNGRATQTNLPAPIVLLLLFCCYYRSMNRERKLKASVLISC